MFGLFHFWEKRPFWTSLELVWLTFLGKRYIITNVFVVKHIFFIQKYMLEGSEVGKLSMESF